MRKVLVLQLSRFGDILQTTPLLKNLKEKDYNVNLVIDEKNKTLCEDIPVIDRLFPLQIGKILTLLKKNELKKTFVGLNQFLEKLQNESFDLLINLNHSQINLFISDYLKIPEKIGFKISENKFINYLYSIIKTSRKLNPFNLVDVFNYFMNYKVSNLQISNQFIDKIEIPKNYIVLHLGAGHKLRVLPIETMAKFSLKLLEHYKDFFIILSGSKTEIELGYNFQKKIKNNRIINYIGKTDYYQLKYLLKYAKLLISTDTGVIHLAAALNIKILTLFFASAFPFETGPYSDNALIITPNIECYPCKEFSHCKDLKCKKIINEKIILKCCIFLLDNDREKFDDNSVIIYRPYFDDYGIYLKELSSNFDKLYEKRIKIRNEGLGILDGSL